MATSKLLKQVAQRARADRIAAAEERIAKKKREKERAAIQEANRLTPDGFSPAMRAKLVEASKRANEDPRAKAMVEKAALQTRVERLRREQGIGQVAPPIFMGELADEKGRPYDPALARARALSAEQIPPSVGDLVEKERRERSEAAAFPPQAITPPPPPAAPTTKRGRRT